MSKIEDMMSELAQTRDELKLKVHLGSKELQDEWSELEGKWNEFESKAGLGESAEGLGTATGMLGEEISKAYRRLKDAL